ncbi:response regulator [Halomonas marinisediminis]|uniref:DNA-binding response regulator n=1 Tax=Halomonas marinisediminis TaxID=2546095 RepID=A0ABY2D590_9GAMM|nr:response regulator [Halomonas marinisediminis]TDB01805.1 DNA-binding response regulator [Halomonas marinisediminis]
MNSHDITHRSPLILCAEDQEDLRADICDELREAGYAVLEAADGEATLQQVDACTPDLILCDINMPGLNGYGVLDAVREQRPHLADTPFVFLTALSDPREVVEGKRLGADDYLVKPIDFDLLLATIDARLRQVSRMRDKSSHELQELRQAMSALHQEVSQQAFQAATRVLDLVAPGMVLLDCQGEITFINQRAQQLAAASDVLRLNRTLSVRGAMARKLRETLAAATLASCQGEEPVFSLRLPHQPGGHGLLVLICALGQTPEATGKDASVVVLLSAPDQRPPLPREILASLFGLTPTESRIATALLEGLRSEEIAEQMGVSPTTVAFHLRNLFQKTDTHRQADLIALLLAGSMTAYLEER